MRSRRSVDVGRVAFVSILFIASAAHFGALTVSARQPRQEPAAGQKTEQPKAGPQADKSAPAPASSVPPAGNTSPTGPQLSVENDRPVITHTDMVTLTVTVTDTYGRFVTGLGKNAFTVTDDKVAQDITFFSDEDAPVSLGVIFDVSGSMSGDKINKAREALKKFIDTSHTGDEYFLIGFNNRAQLLLDRTRDSDALMQKLTFVQTKGQTALYDACYLGVERVTRGAPEAGRAPYQRRAGQQLALQLHRAAADAQGVRCHHLRRRHRGRWRRERARLRGPRHPRRAGRRLGREGVFPLLRR